MKTAKVTAEHLASWHPKRQEEITDREVPGLLVRSGPSGVKSFFYWTDVRDDATGNVRRQRVKLGRWSADGGGGTLTIGAARKLFLDRQAKRRALADGSGSLTVADLAEAYRRDILAQREASSLAWSWGIIRTHVLHAKPYPKRPAFGEWPARDVEPEHVAAVVRAAKDERTVEMMNVRGKKVSRRLGGKATARAALREIKAIFSTAIGAGAGGIKMSPAAVLQAKALGLKKEARGRYLAEKEIKALFDALDLTALLEGEPKSMKLSKTIRLAVAFLLFVPVRSHSLVGARWDEFDLDAGRWTIPVSRLKLHKDARALARPFTAPLPSPAVAILRKLKDLAGKSPYVLASPLPPSDPKAPPKHIGAKVMVRAVARLQEDGRLSLGSTFTIHDLRRTWRTWAGQLGVPFDVAEKSLGHVLPGVAETYARAEMVDRRAEAAELVAAAFDGIRLGKAATVVPMNAAQAS